MDKGLLNQIRRRLDDATRIVVTSHVRPDGDAVSSVLALGLALQDRGKQVQMVLSDGVSADSKHLQGVELISRRLTQPVDLIVTLDSAAQDRTGAMMDAQSAVDINIDHHITNTRFAALNLIDPAAVSTTAILAEHFPALGLDYSPAVVDSMLNGMLTDTIGFRTPNMTPKALRIAADLVEKGADMSALYDRALLRRSYETLRYWGAGLSKLKREGDLVWTTLSLQDRKSAAYPGNDDGELINNISMVEAAAITILLIEQTPQQVKISWRSQGDHDVSQLAVQFGGGGHLAAAGAVIDASLAEAESRVIEAARVYLQGVPA
ncbi:MAG: DHH family phosphoesterase [Anaerolineales bacterium]